MLNRTIAPDFKLIEQIDFIKAHPLVLDNGIKTFIIDAGEQDLVRIELIFDQVNWNEQLPLQTYAGNTLLIEGTQKLKAAEIAERIDFYGAFLQTDYAHDQSGLVLYTLNKHLSATLPVLQDIITQAIFPQQELDTFVLKNKQKLNISLEKNDFVGRRVFNQVLFGNTPYGYAIQHADYDALNREQLLDYYRQTCQPANCTIIVAGKVTDQTIQLLNTYLGKDWHPVTSFSKNEFQFVPASGKLHYIEKPDALQSAIRIGQIAIRRTHPDFPALQVLKTVLGGYFGSRLMANIRENKGYTYGIGSALVSLNHVGYFFIASEVGVEVCKATLEEIEKEINRLRNELIPDHELNLVRNYMSGSLLGSLDNAFAHADKFKNIYFSGLDYDYYQRYIHTIKTVTPDRLMELANTYLDYDRMEKVVVGKL